MPKLILLILSATLLTTFAHAADSDDNEAAAEEAMADGDAAADQARRTHAAAAQQEREAQAQAAAADRARAKAEAREAAATTSLQASESKLTLFKAEYQRQSKLRKAAEARVAVADGKLRVMQGRLTQAKSDLAEVSKQRATIEAKLAGLHKEMDDVKANLEETGLTIDHQKNELRERQQTQKRMDAEYQRLKLQYHVSKDKIAAQAAHLDQARAAERVKTDQLNYARGQTERAPAAATAGAPPQPRAGSSASAPRTGAVAPTRPSTPPTSNDL